MNPTHFAVALRYESGKTAAPICVAKGVDALVELLAAKGIGADSIHGDKPQPARLRALERFKAGEVRVLVATDVAARGLDIDDLPVVVNVDLPIVGDATYGDFKANRAFAKRTGLRRLFLHSAETRFDYDFAGQSFSFKATAPLPREFMEAMR